MSPPTIREWTTPESARKLRLDHYLVQSFPELSRAKVQKLIASGKVLVDGKAVKANFILSSGEHIHLELQDEVPPHVLTPHTLELAILYEDGDLLVFNKPAGISVHPGAGTREPTIVEALFHHYQSGKHADAKSKLRPGIVHRLDKDTSGLMVYAKNEYAQLHLSKQFASKQIPREYLALLDGLLQEPRWEYESYLYRDPRNRKRFASISEKSYVQKYGREPEKGSGYRLAQSLFVREETYQWRLTLASVFLRTGRTHQIRVHSKDLSCPVLGDPVYNSPHEFPKVFDPELRKKLGSLKRQILHAKTLGFVHPRSGKELRFEAAPPSDFQEILDLLKPYKDPHA